MAEDKHTENSEELEISEDKTGADPEDAGVTQVENKLMHDGGLATPEDFTPPEELYRVLLEKILKYHPSDDVSMVEKAYRLATEAHKDQKRKSGEPYIMHPICVAIILAELEMDKETIVAGLLHDVIEDTEMTKEDVAAEFSEEVAELVDGVTKLTQLNISQDKIEIQAENLRKMFLAMAKDIRVIIIKLADRLHNLRTLQYQSKVKQIEKARETMDIYAPLAHRLGISKIKIELDDLCMQYLYPDVYKELQREINERMSEKESYIQNMVDEVTTLIKENEIKAEIDGRVKHIFSIYKKMKTQNKTLDQIYDIFALRIKVNTVGDCYAALGFIHSKYKPIPGRIKDYIAMPKANMYQSLHTTVIGNDGQPFEIQIRTFDMHRTAEFGIAAHWKYKESGSKTVSREEEKLNWLREILEWQKTAKDNREFMSGLKTDLDLFRDQVYVFTPAGDVKPLPSGSTPIDFAYIIHTAVGNTMVGARINGVQVPIDTPLKSGDRVEIITSGNSRGPSMDWLKIVKSPQAKTKINQWFRQEHKSDNIIRGKQMLQDYCKAHQIDVASVTTPECIAAALKKYHYPDWDSLMAAIGHGGMKEGQVVNKLLEERDKSLDKTKTGLEIIEEMLDGRKMISPKGGIKVKGLYDIDVRFSKCCSPVPGDEIVGFVTRGRGASIHRTDCINIICMEEHDRMRLIDAEWVDPNGNSSEEYICDICVYTTPGVGIGIIKEISSIFEAENIKLSEFNSRSNKQGRMTINIQFGVKSKEHLDRLLLKIRMLDGVYDIERTIGR